MAYQKQTWADGQAGGTPISADRLNHMETGIDAGLDKAEADGLYAPAGNYAPAGDYATAEDIPPAVDAYLAANPPEGSSSGVPLSRYVGYVEPTVYSGVTMTVGTVAPSWEIAGYIPPTNAARVTVVGPALVNDGSGFFWAMWNGSNNGANVVAHEEAFVLQGPKLSGMFYSYGDQDLQIMADGKLLKASFTVLPNVANTYFVNIDFTDDTSATKLRNIRVFAGQLGVAQWLYPAGGDIWADKTRRYTFGVAAADSYFHGAGNTTEGSISGGTLGNTLSILAGGKCTVISAGAQGGTGYRNPGTGGTGPTGPNGQTPFGSATRKAKFSEWAAKVDCIVVAGGANDGAKEVYSVASVVAAAQQCWTDYAALAPGKPLLVIGIQSGVYPAINADLDALNTALKNAALAHPNVTAYIDDRSPAGMITGTGKINGKTGDGNADIMVCSDGVHLTRGANVYVTRQRIDKMGEHYVPAIF